MAPERILVPTDFGPEADEALKTAIELCRQLQTDLILLHVRDERDGWPWSYSGGEEAAVRTSLHQLLKPAQALGIRGDVVLVHGVPWREIIDVAKERCVGLIIMGTHNASGWPRFILGSVAESVIRHADCPVMVTRYKEGSPTSLV